MRLLKEISLGVFSERGLDYGLEQSQFNAPWDDAHTDFDSYWMSQIRHLEKLLEKQFPGGTIFISDHFDDGEIFGVDIDTSLDAAKVLQFLLSHIEVNHPDASICVGEILWCPTPVSRLIIGKSCSGIEQDALAWYLDRARVSQLVVSNLDDLQRDFSMSNISRVFPWLGERHGASLKPAEFWRKIYSGEGFAPMEDRGYDGYHTGGNIGSRLVDYWVNSDFFEPDNFYVSSSLPKQRVIKVECSRTVFNERFLDRIISIVHEIDRTWAIRFAIFESLTGPDSYLGGIIVTPESGLVLENG